MDAGTFQVSAACEAEMKGTRMKKRVFDILSKALGEPKEGWAQGAAREGGRGGGWLGVEGSKPASQL